MKNRESSIWRKSMFYGTALFVSMAVSTVMFASGSAPKKPPLDSDHAAQQAMSSINYTELLKPIDIYAPPQGAQRLISLTELYGLIQSRGVSLKVSRETLNATSQQLKTENDKKTPVITLDISNNQRWSKTLSDSNAMDDYSDREKVSGSRTISSSAGFTVSGAPVQGVGYRIQFPQLANSQQAPSTSTGNPPRPDSGAFSAALDLSLMRDNPIFSELISRKKTSLTLAAAKETFRADTLRKILESESSFYSLIQKYLQLSVQERSFNLAKALEHDVKEKIAAGESSELEATRAELQKAQAEADFMSSQIDYEAAVANFRNSLAFDEGEGKGVFPDPRALDVNVDGFRVPDQADAEIQRSNPDISLARLAKQGAEADLEAARRSTLPVLALSMSYGNSAPGNGWGKTTVEALKPNDRVFGVGLSFSKIIFNDTSRNTVQQALVSKQKLDFAADETERRIQKETSALIKKLDIGGRRYRIAKISREIAEKKLNSEYEKFKAGESSVRNVIDSQTEVNSARISEIGSRIEMLTGYGQLRNLMGKLPEGLTIKY